MLSDLFIGSTGVINFADGDVTITHSANALTISGGATSITGAATFTNTVTVGVDDTGQDVKFFGATSGAYMMWDQATDDLKLAGGAGLVQSGSGANTLTGATSITGDSAYTPVRALIARNPRSPTASAIK